MSDWYLAEIRAFAFNYAPKGWAECNGQLLSINQNQALFSLLGIYYGGNGTSTFALPDLRSRAPMHWGTGAAGTSVNLGERDGTELHTLTAAETPTHVHAVAGQTAMATTGAPAGNVFAAGETALYDSTPAGPVTLAPATVSTVGGSQPHENRQPFLVLNYCIALVGIYPSRN